MVEIVQLFIVQLFLDSSNLSTRGGVKIFIVCTHVVQCLTALWLLWFNRDSILVVTTRRHCFIVRARMLRHHAPKKEVYHNENGTHVESFAAC